MKLISMLDSELVLEKVPGSSRQEVYSAMLQKLAEQSELTLDVPGIVQTMIDHENNDGIIFPQLALPHLRCNELKDMFIVVGLPENSGSSSTDRIADIVMMILIGENMSDIYLKMLSTLAHHLTDPAASAAMTDAAHRGKSAFWEYLEKSNIRLRNVVTAEDVMSPVENCLHSDAPLSEAFDMFHTTHLRFLPVVDNAGKLAGEMSSQDVVKKFIPEYIFMMDNANFMNDFSVFNKIFDTEHSQPIAQYMNPEPPRAALDTPLFHLTLLLMKNNCGNVYIVDDENNLKGIFAIHNIVSKVLRG